MHGGDGRRAVRPRLFKVEGAGNDFLLGIGEWADRLAHDLKLVRRLCDRRLGVGADGAIALTAESSDRVRLVHRNADGGEAVFCANGTRCAAWTAVELLGCEARLVVETAWKPIPAQVDGSEVRIEIPALSEAPGVPAIDAPDGVSGLRFLHVGVPHLVAVASDLRGLELSAIAPPLRDHPVLAPHGANVNFYEVDFVAVALVVMEARELRRVELIPASGDRLIVEALGQPPRCPIRLTGPTRFIAEIEPSEDLLRTI